MSILINPWVASRTPTARLEPIPVNPEMLGESVEQGRRRSERNNFRSVVGSTSTTIADITDIHISSPSLPAENTVRSVVGWQEEDWSPVSPKMIVVSSNVSTPTETMDNSLQPFLEMQLREDRLWWMSPESRTRYERIKQLRAETELLEFNRVESLQDRGEDALLSTEVLAFCSQQGILQYLLVALDLVKTCFSSIQEVHLQREQDPETSEEWLVLDVSVQGDEEKVLEAYDRYVDRLVSIVPWPERHKIRLSYNLI